MQSMLRACAGLKQELFWKSKVAATACSAALDVSSMLLLARGEVA